MAARDQARWLSHHCPQKRRAGEALQPSGNDLTRRFPLIVEALVRLRSRSCIVDCEAVACNNNGVACLPSGTARIEPLVLPSTVARVEGLVGRRDLPGATNAVEAVEPKGLHQVNRPIA